MEVLPWALSGGWASGISAYAVVLLVGLLDRVGWIDGPAVLARTEVLVVFAVLTAVEFVADKVPYVDSAWDAVHTVIRPVIAAVLGVLIADDAGTLGQALAAGGMGATALVTHLSKAGIRLAVNGSPEPVSNAGVSLTEDAGVVGVVTLAAAEPWLSAGVALVLLAVMVVAAVWLASRIRRGWRRLGRQLEAWGLGGSPPAAG